MSDKTLIEFDYTAIDGEERSRLEFLVGEIHKHHEAGQKAIINIGEHIAAAHAILAKSGKDGRFTDWVACELGLSRQTAYNYMRAFEKFGECESIAQFDATAMYELASPNTPEPVFKAALKMAAKGQRIHAAEVKQLVKQHEEKVQKTSESNRTTVLQHDCPHGGPHKRDASGVCVACHDPPAEPARRQSSLKPEPPQDQPDDVLADSEPLPPKESSVLNDAIQTLRAAANEAIKGMTEDQIRMLAIWFGQAAEDISSEGKIA